MSADICLLSMLTSDKSFLKNVEISAVTCKEKHYHGIVTEWHTKYRIEYHKYYRKTLSMEDNKYTNFFTANLMK